MLCGLTFDVFIEYCAKTLKQSSTIFSRLKKSIIEVSIFTLYNLSEILLF